MTSIVDVKSAILNLLKSDVTLQGLVGKDSRGNYAIYQGYIQHEIHKPCVTVEDVTDQAEVAGLNDGYDGSKRYQWQYAVIQIDCWSDRHADERDKLQVAVQECLLRKENQDSLYGSGIIYVQEPLVSPLDEVDVKPPLWRKSLRYRVFYVLEVS